MILSLLWLSGFFCGNWILFILLIFKNKIVIKKNNLIESIFSGILFHGLYLGGVFFSISIGMPAGIAALIVTLQPIFTNILCGPLLNEKITSKQWIGAILGFFGAVLVIGFDLGKDILILGLIAK